MFTYDRGRNVREEYQQEFRGINHRLRPAETELSDALNMSSREYPVLTVRPDREFISDVSRGGNISPVALSYDTIAYLSIDADGKQHVAVNGENKYTFDKADSSRYMVRMGAMLCVFPDGVIINTRDYTVDTVKKELSLDSQGTPSSGYMQFDLEPSTIDGNLDYTGFSEPSNVTAGQFWYNTTTEDIKLCTSVSPEWVEYSAIFTAQKPMTIPTPAPTYLLMFTSFSGGCAVGSGTLMTYNGSEYESTGQTVNAVSSYPSNPSDGDMCVLTDSAARTNSFRIYNSKKAVWTTFPNQYTKISSAWMVAGSEMIGQCDIADYFNVGDTVNVNGEYKRVWAKKEHTTSKVGYIVVDNCEIVKQITSGTFKISRDLPDGISNVFECANRLWASNDAGTEIYASKLGDPFNWFSYSGTAADSYAINVGGNGKFTGGVSYSGYPHFFKENQIFKIYGSYPFRLYTLDCPGIASGDNKSAAVMGGCLIYKGVSGFYLYDGDYPEIISDAIYDICGPDVIVNAAAANDTAYYAAANGMLYTYERGVWHMQDGGFDDLITTSRDIIGVKTAADKSSKYLISLCGVKYSWQTMTGQTDLDTCFDAVYSLDDDVPTLRTPGTAAQIETGRYAEIGGKYYRVLSSVIEAGAEDTVAYTVEIPEGGALTAGKTYKVRAFTKAPTEWRFTTPLLGLGIAEDKYYSHIILRYKSDEPAFAVLLTDGKAYKSFMLPPKKVVGSTSLMPIPAKSETVQIKISGKESFALYSAARYIEEGTDL